jgi:CHAD domain-containing protein
MPSVLSFEKDIDKQLQKHIKKHIRKVIEYCRDKNMSDDKAIHQIRRRFKKLRALLHIFSYDLKKGFFKEQNELYKTYATKCSKVRDTKVLEDLYFKIVQKYSLDQDSYLKILALIKNSKEHIDIKELRDTIGKSLKENLSYVKNYTFQNNKDKFIFDNINKVYKQVRFYSGEVKCKDDDVKYHSLRKWLNYYFYQSQLFKNSDKKRNKQIKHLISTLGEIHDITVFKEFLQRTPYNDQNDFVTALYQEQQILKSVALELVRKLML